VLVLHRSSLFSPNQKEKGTGGERGVKRCEPLTVRDQVSRFVLAMHICRSRRLATQCCRFARQMTNFDARNGLTEGLD